MRRIASAEYAGSHVRAVLSIVKEVRIVDQRIVVGRRWIDITRARGGCAHSVQIDAVAARASQDIVKKQPPTAAMVDPAVCAHIGQRVSVILNHHGRSLP